MWQVRWLDGVAPAVLDARVGAPVDDSGGAGVADPAAELVPRGRFGTARGAAAGALAGDGPVATALAHLRRSALAFGDGRVGDVADLADAVLAVDGLPAELHAVARTDRLLAALAEDEPLQAHHCVEALLTGAQGDAGGDPESTALLALGLLAWDDARVAEALGLLRGAAERSERPPDGARTGSSGGRHQQPRLALAAMLTALGELDRALAEIAAVDGRAGARPAGDPRWDVAVRTARARVHLAAGDLPAAVDEARAGLAEAERRGTWIFVPAGQTVLAEAALATGDLAAAADQLRRRDEAWRERSGGAAPPVAARWVEARLAEIRVGPVAAAPTIVPIVDDLPHRKRLLIEEPAAAAWFVRALLAAGERPRAEVIAGCAQLIAAGNPGFPALAASAAHAQGLLDGDPDLLVAAADRYRRPWPRGSAAEDAGVALADVGDRATARSRYERAAAAYERAGAARDAARARRRLAGTGARSSRRRARPVGGWASLTDTERRVAVVVAAGLTNAEAARKLYLSRHTVDYHLRQIFRKLTIRSRVELATVVAGRRGGILRGSPL
jgi:DNA-binding CsgD family transcriptional regulator